LLNYELFKKQSNNLIVAEMINRQK